jgi:hypothetical protein
MVELGKESSLLTGSSATPHMDDVRAPFIHLSRIFQHFQPSFIFIFCCRTFVSYVDFSPPLSFSAFDEGIYLSWYPIHRVP